MKLLRLLCFLCLGSVVAAAADVPLVYVDISGPWRLAEGDNPGFAVQGFDDSAWKTVNLPMNQEARRLRRANAPEEFFWLRKTVELPPEAVGTRLTLTVGGIREGYQVFANGSLIGGTLGGDPGNPSISQLHLAVPRHFELPVVQSQRLSVALRVWDAALPGTAAWTLLDRGPWLITSSTIAPRDAAENAVNRQRLVRMADFAQPLVVLCIASFIFLIWLSARSKRELLWLSLYLATHAIGRFIRFGSISLDSQPFGFPSLMLLLWGRFLPSALQAQFAADVFRIKWLPVPAWLLTLLVVAVQAETGNDGNFVIRALAVNVLTLVALALAWRNETPDSDWKGATRKWMILGTALTVVSLGITSFGGAAILRRATGGSTDIFVPPVMALLMTVVLIRRLLRDRDEKVRLTGELESARTVQQLLLPASRVTTGTHQTEAVYEPAQEVGGDFYWSRKTEEGALLVVVGDVSGKGLKAAMLVSVAVGSLRNERSAQPGLILSALNESLVGNVGGGFVTCCCARFDPDGTVTLANAGNPSPYADGREVELEAGLPLGLMGGLEYAETVVQGEYFTFVSDGVVEAANAAGELFGFDRTREICGESASGIASAAQAWGQNDDITVVTVRRAA